MAELEQAVQRLAVLEAEVVRARKRRDELIRQLALPPHNHTYREIGEAAGITHQAVAQIKAKGTEARRVAVS